jgi:hypothetical protein
MPIFVSFVVILDRVTEYHRLAEADFRAQWRSERSKSGVVQAHYCAAESSTVSAGLALVGLAILISVSTPIASELSSIMYSKSLFRQSERFLAGHDA